MKSHGIAVNDLNSLVKRDLDGNISEDQLHLSEQGNARCAEKVIEIIKRHL